MEKKLLVEDYGIWEIRPDLNRKGHRGLWIKESSVIKLQKEITEHLKDK